MSLTRMFRILKNLNSSVVSLAQLGSLSVALPAQLVVMSLVFFMFQSILNIFWSFEKINYFHGWGVPIKIINLILNPSLILFRIWTFEWVAFFFRAFRYWFKLSNINQHCPIRTNIFQYWWVTSNIVKCLYHLCMLRVVQLRTCCWQELSIFVLWWPI